MSEDMPGPPEVRTFPDDKCCRCGEELLFGDDADLCSACCAEVDTEDEE